MQSECDVGTADQPRSHEPGLAIISISLALPTTLDPELLLRSPDAEQLTRVLAATSWLAWLIWAWLAMTVLVRVFLVFWERAAAGTAGDLLYTVRTGDSLSGISARVLGNARRWPELFELNRGVARMPDGRALTNPELVWPGLWLRLPDLDVASTPSLAIAAVSPFGTDDPVQTVATYYQLLDQEDVTGAAALMRDGPRSWREAADSEVQRGRFAIRQAKVLHMDPSQLQATVAVDLEVTVDARTSPRRYMVTWQLTRGPQGWRLVSADVSQPP